MTAILTTPPEAPRFEPRRTGTRRGLVYGALILVIGLVAVLAMTTGEFPLSVSDVMRALLHHADAGQQFIVNEVRLPRLLTGLGVGAALAVSGSLFQSISRNPLGSPDLLGFTAGAATAALLAIVIWQAGPSFVAVAAVLGGIAAAMVVAALAARDGHGGYRLVLAGIGVAAMAEAANSYLVAKANIVDAQTANLWLIGSLDGRAWPQVLSVGVALVLLLPAAVALRPRLQVLEMGDECATALGVRTGRTRLLAGGVAVLLCAVGTACTGPVVFVALTAPQIARRLLRSTGPQLAGSALLGAGLLAVSDFAAQRVFAPHILPVGVVTGALGGLYLAWLMYTAARKGRT